MNSPAVGAFPNAPDHRGGVPLEKALGIDLLPSQAEGGEMAHLIKERLIRLNGDFADGAGVAA